MKNLAFLLALICVVMVSLPLTASASALKSILEVLNENSEEHRQHLKNDDVYWKNEYWNEPSMSYTLVDNEPILKVYPFNSGYNGRLSLEERTELENEQGYFKYVAFSEDFVYLILVAEANVFSNYEDGLIAVDEWFSTDPNEQNEPSILPPCLRDVMIGSSVQSFCGQICEIQNVVMFDHRSGLDPITVYYETDKGTFVRCYPTRKSEATAEFSITDYQKIEQERYDLAIADDNAEQIGGSFLDYANSEYSHLMYVPRAFVTYKTYRISALTAGSVILAGSITAVVIYNRRKKRLAVESSAIDEPPTEL